jgi:Ca-activated chloride channel family protein
MQLDTLPLLDDPRAPTAKGDRPGCGCLVVTRESTRLVLPLRSVSFSAKVVDRVAEVTVEQTFENPHRELLEAVYIFPLPGGAAVSRLELHVGGKKLLGIVEERGEARRQYAEAVAQGKKAAILEQERDDVFTVKVGNLPPGEAATIKMVYSERLPAFQDGETELRIPLVVAPRYIPGSPLERESTGDGTESDTTRVPDASRISPPRLAPGLRGDVKLAIDVALLGEGEVQDLGCTQHATRLGAGSGKLTIALSRKDELLDRDFVLRWRTSAAQEKPVLLVARKGQDVYGLLSLVPPTHVKAGQGARDVVILLDRSGSMQGEKMDSARKACEKLLGMLEGHDRFAVCAFSDARSWFEKGFMPADRGGIASGKKWLSTVQAAGGTELDSAIAEVLALFSSQATGDRPASGMVKVKVNRMPILVLVTDGEVGNESEILRRIEGRLGGLRVFTLGIDTAVNAAFLRRLAQIGRGTSTFCEPGADLEDALTRIGREIGTPVLLDIEVEDRGLGFDAASLTPERLPDLFAGRTASIFFKCTKTTGSLRVRAKRAEGGVFEQVVAAETVELNALSQLWAKSRVADLEDRFRLAYGGQGGGLEAARGEIIGLALEHQLLTRFTAFLVIDHAEAERRLALPRRTVVQAVETPAGWAEKEEATMKDLSLGSLRASKSMARGAAAPPPAARPGGIVGSVYSIIGGAPAAPAPTGGRGGPPAGMGGAMADLGGGGDDDELVLGNAPMGSLDLDDGAADPFAGGLAGADAQLVELESCEADPFGADPFAPPPETKLKAGGKSVPNPASSNRSAPKKAPMTPPPGSTPKRDLGRSADRLKAGSVSGPQRKLETVLDELGKELAAILARLEAKQWPKDDGALLTRLRDEAVSLLVGRGLTKQAARTFELLTATLTTIVADLARHRGKPAEHADAVRAAYEALGAQCRAELAPLLGPGGSPWEASI